MHFFCYGCKRAVCSGCMMNTVDLDLADPEIADAFAGDKVGDTCTLDNVQLRVKRISMSHDKEWKDGKETGKKVVNGSITFDVLGFDYGDHEFSAADAKGNGTKGTKGTNVTEAPPAPEGYGNRKPVKPGGLVVSIGLGKKK